MWSQPQQKELKVDWPVNEEVAALALLLAIQCRSSSFYYTRQSKEDGTRTVVRTGRCKQVCETAVNLTTTTKEQLVPV